MKKVLMIGDSPTIHTGFGRVMKEIALGLANAGYDVKVIGWCYFGEEYDFPFQIISVVDPHNDYFGINMTRIMIEAWEPDILFTLGDLHMIDWVAQMPERKNLTWVGYFPIDGLPFPKIYSYVVESMDYPVTYSKFGYDVVREFFPNNNNIKLITHGVDTDIYKPLDKDMVEKFKKRFNLDKKWIIGNVSRNQWRKNLPALFKAFSEFNKDKEDVRLYYHGVVNDVGWNIEGLIDRFNLSGKVIYPKDINPNKGFPERDLNMIYNMIDLFVLGSVGEGYGLPLIESQSAGTPILTTNYSANSELTQGEDELIKVGMIYAPVVKDRDAVIDYALIDHDDLVAKLNNFYYNRELIDKYSKLGREFALKNQWKDKINEFIELFKSI